MCFFHISACITIENIIMCSIKVMCICIEFVSSSYKFKENGMENLQMAKQNEEDVTHMFFASNTHVHFQMACRPALQ